MATLFNDGVKGNKNINNGFYTNYKKWPTK